MLTTIRFQNFKSWRDTGEIRFAPLTGFFGTNSSGKTAILHFLLMLKQTVESNDRQLVLKLDGTYTDLGAFSDLIHNHDIDQEFSFSVNLVFPEVESSWTNTIQL